MPEVIYVSNEEELKASLPGNHGVTVIAADYAPAIFDGYNIQYCFNETPEHDWNNFYGLKHAYHPYKGINVIYDSPLYITLLNKVLQCGHSVAFVLSVENFKLLRLCQCFLSAVSYSLHVEEGETGDREIDQELRDFLFGRKKWSPVPFLIGKAEINPGVVAPVWASYWDVNIQILDDLLIETFKKAFGAGFAYSQEGLVQLQKFLEARVHKFVGNKKLRLYTFEYGTQSYRCRQNIEGPREMLNTASFVKAIEEVAVEASQLLKKYKIKTPNSNPLQPHNGISNQHDPHGLWQSAADCEASGMYNVCSAVIQLHRLVFDDSMPSREKGMFYNDASGELATPTPEAIAERIIRTYDNHCCDGVGNLHSFKYAVSDKNWVAVWPEGEKELMTKLCGAEVTENYYKKKASKTVASSNPVGGIEEHSTPDNNKQVIKISFEACDKKMLVTYKVDGEVKKPRLNLNKGPLRFLAFLAGVRQGYCFAFKDPKAKNDKKVLLIKRASEAPFAGDTEDAIDLSMLFKTAGNSFVESITSALPEMCSPFLKLSDGMDMPEDNYNRVQKFKQVKLADKLFEKDAHYPTIKHNGESLNNVKLRKHIIFDITLSSDFKESLINLSLNDLSDRKTILDFIIKACATIPTPAL